MDIFSFDAPLWVVITLFFVTFAIIRSKEILDIIDRFNRSNRAYSQERKKLELLKLRYEIEAIKKEHDLENLEEKIDSRQTEFDEKYDVSFRSSVLQTNNDDKEKQKAAGFFIGGPLGFFLAIITFRYIPYLYELIKQGSNSTSTESNYLVGVLFVFFITIIIVALGATIFEKYIKGFFTSLFFTTLTTYSFWIVYLVVSILIELYI